jgi:FkbM family methyltransferase
VGPETVRTVRIGGRVLRFAVSARREDERLGAVAADEGRMLARLLAALRDRDTFFDVGANVGTVTLPVAVARPVECLAFEPEPANASRLARNAELNGLVNVTVIEAAMWSEAGTVGLRVGGPVGTGTGHVVAEGGDGAIEVPAATIDAFAGDGRAAPSVLKLDVEGAELEVLRGAEATLESGRIRELFVETHPGPLARRGEGEAEVVALLGGFGYAEVWAAARASETHRHFRRAE